MPWGIAPSPPKRNAAANAAARNAARAALNMYKSPAISPAGPRKTGKSPAARSPGMGGRKTRRATRRSRTRRSRS